MGKVNQLKVNREEGKQQTKQKPTNQKKEKKEKKKRNPALISRLIFQFELSCTVREYKCH